MKRIVSVLFCAVTMLTGCREFQENPLPKDLIVTSETELSTADGFINSVYSLKLTVEPKNRVSDFPVTATYTVNKKAVVKSGVKEYSDNDTLMFSMRNPREISVQPTETGTYRLMMTFKDNGGKEIGTKELNFNIQATDLNMYIVRDGKRVENMEETENFLGYEGSFIVRVNSEREELNKGRLKLTANITGSSVQVKNWRDKEAKISQTDDLPETVDFLVEYKNVALGKTRFLFTAESQNSSTVLRDSINVQESRPGTLTLNTTYNEEKNFYSREELWVGQTDSVGYLITPDPKAVSNVYKIKYELKEPGKFFFYNTKDPQTEYLQERDYEANKWYDFSGRLSGKFYYKFRSPTSYSDTVIISLQNGDMGPITKYKLFVSAKQSDDFDFNVTFKPTLDDKGYDVIKLSELREGINDLMTLTVTDENPYSKFDYQLGASFMNEVQRNIVQSAKKIGYENSTNIPYGDWLAGEFGELTKTKSFKILCEVLPNENNAGGYIGTYNWDYLVQRIGFNGQRYGDIKTVTRQIKIIDDRMNFTVDLSANNTTFKESVFQNEEYIMYRIKYISPSDNADDYELTVTSTKNEVSDVYIMDKNGEFTIAEFATATSPPASYNAGGSQIDPSLSGRIRIKGKEEGTAELSFTLKHKTTGTEKTIKKNVTTIADHVVYDIEPAPTIDAMKIERAAIPFGEEFHTYQNPRFKIRLDKSKVYEHNTSGTASVMFSTEKTLINDNKLTIKGGTYGQAGYHGNTDVEYGTEIQLAYDTDYFVTVNAPTSLPWKLPVTSVQWLDVKMTIATDQETKIVAEETGKIKYTLRAYKPPIFTVDATITRHDNIYPYTENYIERPSENSPYLFRCSDTDVAVYPSSEYPDYRWKVTVREGSADYYVNNATITGESRLNDANETSNISLEASQATYIVTRVKGAYIEIDNSQDRDHFAQCTMYYPIQADVTDNWGYRTSVYFTPPQKFELLADYMFEY